MLVERLLSDPKYKMDPMVSLYYYAPICTILNGLAALVVEVPQMSMANIIANTLPTKRFARFARKPKPTPLTKPLLIFPTTNQTHPPTHRQKLPPPPHSLWRPQRYRRRRRLHTHLGRPVTILQFFGYGLALAGLVYYKLGGDTIKQNINQLKLSWPKFGQKNPALRQATIFGAILLTLLVLVGGLGPNFTPKQRKYVKDILGGSRLGW